MTARHGEQNQRKNTDKRFHGRYSSFTSRTKIRQYRQSGKFIFLKVQSRPLPHAKRENSRAAAKKDKGRREEREKEKNLMEMFWNTDKKRTFAVRLLPQKQPDVATATALWPGLRWKARQ